MWYNQHHMSVSHRLRGARCAQPGRVTTGKARGLACPSLAPSSYCQFLLTISCLCGYCRGHHPAMATCAASVALLCRCLLDPVQNACIMQCTPLLHVNVFVQVKKALDIGTRCSRCATADSVGNGPCSHAAAARTGHTHCQQCSATVRTTWARGSSLAGADGQPRRTAVDDGT
jgi:hypothetical protein